MTNTYPAGEAWVLGVVFTLLVVLNAIEIVCEAKGWPSLGYRIAGWAKGNPWFVGLIVLALGTFLAHFFLNGLPSAG